VHFNPDNQQILYEARGLEIPVKRVDDFYCLVGVMGDLVKIQVFG